MWDWTGIIGNIISCTVLLYAIMKDRKKQHDENVRRLDAIEKALQGISWQLAMVWKWYQKEHNINGD